VPGSGSDSTRGKCFKLPEGRFGLAAGGKCFAQRAVRPWHSCPESCGCPIPGGAQGQAGWGTGQVELVGTLSPQQGVGTEWALRSLST